MPDTTAATAVSLETHHALEQLLFLEAELIDDHRYAEWLDLFAEDIHYWMPVRTARLPREEAREFEGIGGAAHFDDNLDQLRTRVRKLLTGRAWSEIPSSRTRHLITNIRAQEVAPGEYGVKSNFFIYRTRSERYSDSFAGERHDTIRAAESGTGFVIARRRIVLDQTIVLANNMSTFF